MNELGFFIDFVKKRDEEGACFAGAVLGSGNNAFACNDKGDGFFLDWSRYEISSFGECQQYFLAELEFIEIFVFSGLNILDVKLVTLVCLLTSLFISLFSLSESLSIISIITLQQILKSYTPAVF